MKGFETGLLQCRTAAFVMPYLVVMERVGCTRYAQPMIVGVWKIMHIMGYAPVEELPPRNSHGSWHASRPSEVSHGPSLLPSACGGKACSGVRQPWQGGLGCAEPVAVRCPPQHRAAARGVPNWAAPGHRHGVRQRGGPGSLRGRPHATHSVPPRAACRT